MSGVKTVNNYTCADCLYHKCICKCKGGKRACDGRCVYDKKSRKCTVKICSNFVLDKLVRMC